MNNYCKNRASTSSWAHEWKWWWAHELIFFCECSSSWTSAMSNIFTTRPMAETSGICTSCLYWFPWKHLRPLGHRDSPPFHIEQLLIFVSLAVHGLVARCSVAASTSKVRYRYFLPVLSRALYGLIGMCSVATSTSNVRRRYILPVLVPL